MTADSSRALTVFRQISKKTGSLLNISISDKREPFQETMYFTCVSKKTLESLVKSQENEKLVPFYEELRLATKSLYKTVYQVVGTLAMAIVNSYTILKLKKGVQSVNEKFHEHADILDAASDISSRIDDVLQDLIKSPSNVDYCKEVWKLVEDYTNKIAIPLLRDKGAKFKDVVQVNYGFHFHYEDINTIEDMMEFLSGRKYNQDDPPLGLRVGDVDIQLSKGLWAGEEPVFEQHFYNFDKNPDLKSALTPVRLHIEGDIIYDHKTVYAGFLDGMKANLMNSFDTKTIEVDGCRIIIYCPKPGQLDSGKLKRLAG